MAKTRGRIVIETQGDVLVISGPLDESARLPELLDRATAGRLVLDLGGVTFINSLGVRDWIRMQAAAQRAGVTIELRRVAEPVIHQLNMIIATRGPRISSFFAPYACDGCGREESMLIDAVAHARGLAELSAPAMTCVECGAQMAFNDFPERYFSFLSV
ncbi:MAG TPA: STAS domain-containing protein [Kofleriaceae bacterium]